jgi:uncharacterized protein YjbI with pentapeptide repeats
LLNIDLYSVTECY